MGCEECSGNWLFQFCLVLQKLHTSPLRLEWILGTLKVPNSLIVACPCTCNLLLYQAERRGPAGSKHALAFKQPAKTCFELLKLWRAYGRSLFEYKADHSDRLLSTVVILFASWSVYHNENTSIWVHVLVCVVNSFMPCSSRQTKVDSVARLPFSVRLCFSTQMSQSVPLALPLPHRL